MNDIQILTEALGFVVPDEKKVRAIKLLIKRARRAHNIGNDDDYENQLESIKRIVTN